VVSATDPYGRNLAFLDAEEKLSAASEQELQD
jgi:hypothetical protein